MHTVGVDGSFAGSYKFIDNRAMAKPTEPHPEADYLLQQLGIVQCWNVKVIHCQDAYGLILR
jgi:hypothetical protein